MESSISKCYKDEEGVEYKIEPNYYREDSNVSCVIGKATLMSREYALPYIAGEPVHLGYEALSEEEAFVTPHGLPNYLFPTHIRISRESLSLYEIINCIRKMACRNEAVRYIPQNRYHIPTCGVFLYKTNLLWINQMGHHMESVHIVIRIYADYKTQEYVLESGREKGDRGMHYDYFNALKAYIESKGTIDPYVKRETML